MKWFRVLLTMFLLIGMLLCVNSVVYADDPPDDDSETKVDIGIDGDVEVDIKARGPAELNVGVEGPSEVHIDAGDEVEVNVEAGDESQVFGDSKKLNNSLLIPEDISAYDTKALEESRTAQPGNAIPEEEGTDRIAILGITGAFLAGLPCFFLIRRKVKREEVKK